MEALGRSVKMASQKYSIAKWYHQDGGVGEGGEEGEIYLDLHEI